MVDKEKSEKKKITRRRKSKPDEEIKVTTEKMIALKPTEEIMDEQKPEDEIRPDIESEVGVESKKKLLKKLTKPKESTDEIVEAKEKELTEETTVTVTEEIIELPEDVKLVDKEKPKKKKIIRKSKPDEETVITEEIIHMEPTEEISEEVPEEIQPDIESEVNVETKKKLTTIEKSKPIESDKQISEEIVEQTEQSEMLETTEVIETVEEITDDEKKIVKKIKKIKKPKVTEEIISLKPHEETLVDESIEEAIKPEIESELG
ncbi:hypothetical protein BLA29_008963, partial [Euroglyphus maynei]